MTAPDAERALTALIEAVRGPLGGIRAAIETLNRYPDMDASVAAQLHALIEEQALALSRVVEAAAAEAEAARRARRPLRSVPAPALRDALRRAVAGLDVEVVREAPPLRLRADPPTLGAAVRALAELVENAARPKRLVLALEGPGSVVLRWEGPAVRPERVGRWLGHPLPETPSAATIGDVVVHHGAALAATAGDTPALVLTLTPADEAGGDGATSSDAGA